MADEADPPVAEPEAPADPVETAAPAEAEAPAAAEAPADDAMPASDNQPRLAEIRACIEDLIQQGDHGVLTVKGVRAHVLQKVGAEAGRDYNKAWLKAQVDEIINEIRTSCAGGEDGEEEAEAEEEASPTSLLCRIEAMTFMLRFLERNYKREPATFPQKLLEALEQGYSKPESHRARDGHREAAERLLATQLCAQYASDRIGAGRRTRVSFSGINGRATPRGAGGGGGGGGGGAGTDDAEAEEEEDDETTPPWVGRCTQCEDAEVRVWEYTDG